MVFSCVDSVGVVVNVRDDAAVETAAAGATAVKVKFLTAGDESCAPDVVGEIPHEVLEGAAAFTIVLAFGENLPKIAEGFAKQVAVAQVRMGGELGDGERVLGVDAVKADSGTRLAWSLRITSKSLKVSHSTLSARALPVKSRP
jgi:hypothetical protein